MDPSGFEPLKSYDYVIVGGGTAGCVLADRLSEDPSITVAMIEGGPSDHNLPHVLQLSEWLSLLGGPLDYGYKTTKQERGNSEILHSRAKVLGVKAGATGWTSESMQHYGDKIKCKIAPVHTNDRNPIMADWIMSCTSATGVPIIGDFDAWSRKRGEGGATNIEDVKEGLVDPQERQKGRGKAWSEGVGWLSIAYTPEDGKRQSASVAYVHPIMGKRPNLHLFLETWVHKLDIDPASSTITAVQCTDKHGTPFALKADREVLLCAGAIDSPRLLLLSGVGPKEELENVGVKSVIDRRGVGENLVDHPESIIMWETDELPPMTVMQSDSALFIRRDTSDPRPDLMFHIYTVPFADNTERMGYPRPKHAICMTPNIPRPKSRGKLYLTSSDPHVHPALDFRYFTDPEDYDARTFVDGFKIARKIAATAPFSQWLKHEVAPGPNVQSDEELSEYGRKAAHTVYHPAGTCKMGARDDPLAVVDPELKVIGLNNARVVDASVFPLMVTANPMITVFIVAEKAADMILADYYRATEAKSKI
ncbi:putative oxidoreductase [Pseudohyphozyma bogoriensis]|nr:putative oxidoreductase [Pseudohyphozyma bogoriensis]